MLRRKRARQGLIAFTRYTHDGYFPAEHHIKIADALERVERGELKRLMIAMPPRHGKSELASRRFPAWFLGRNPSRSIIAASYNSDLATDFGREVRDIVASQEYANLFRVGLKADSKSANRWHTTESGLYVAAGVGTAVTGRGAHALLIDDPFKDREEADSERMRERVWRWYTSTAYTRLEGGVNASAEDIYDDEGIWKDFYADVLSGDAEPFEGAIVLINTRWHEDDLSGRLLAAQETGGDQWEVLELPAISKDNKALWPGKYPIERLERIRSAIGPRDWSALYQQAPAPDEGSYFKREWLQFYRDLPDSVYTYGGSDYAVTDNGGDFTVHLVAAMDGDGNIYITDLWREQTTPDKWIDAWLNLVERHEPLTWAEEQGQIIKSVGPFIDRQMQERGVYCARKQFTSVADKPTRARAFQARMASGKVYLPENAPWLADFINELMTFPAGKNDDQVDAASVVFRLLADMTAKGMVPQPEKRDRWDKIFDDDTGDGNWKTV